MNIQFKILSFKSIFCLFLVLFLLPSCSKKNYYSDKGYLEKAEKASREIESSNYNFSSAESQNGSELVSTNLNQPEVINKEEVKKEKTFSNVHEAIILQDKKGPTHQVVSPPDPNAQVKRKTNKKALSAFFWSVFGFLIPIVGIIFMSIGFTKGIKAMNEIRKNRKENKGMGFALAAWIIPIAFIALVLIAAYFYLVYTLFTADDSTY